jgi:hypothetical protein
MERFLAGKADFLLVLRGNLFFNRHLHHNLSKWWPLRQQASGVASVYQPGHLRESACDAQTNTRWLLNKQGFAGEAVLLSRETAARLLKRAPASGSLLGLDFGRLARELGEPMLFHAPSLAQRVGPEPKAQPGRWPAADFDRDWRAPD